MRCPDMSSLALTICLQVGNDEEDKIVRAIGRVVGPLMVKMDALTNKLVSAIKKSDKSSRRVLRQVSTGLVMAQGASSSTQIEAIVSVNALSKEQKSDLVGKVRAMEETLTKITSEFGSSEGDGEEEEVEEGDGEEEDKGKSSGENDGN